MKIILTKDYKAGSLEYPAGTVLDAPCSVALRLMESGEANGVSVRAEAHPFGHCLPSPPEEPTETYESAESPETEATDDNAPPPRQRSRGGRRSAQS